MEENRENFSVIASGCGFVTVVSGLSSASSGGMIPHRTVKSRQSAPSPVDNSRWNIYSTHVHLCQTHMNRHICNITSVKLIYGLREVKTKHIIET